MPQATTVKAPSAVAVAHASLRLFFVFNRAVIDFLEEIVVLPDLDVLGLERDGLFVRLPCFVELAFVLVCDGEIVERRCVGRIELDSPLPAVDRFPPQTTLGDIDAELCFSLRRAPRVGVGRCDRRREEEEAETQNDAEASWQNQAHYSDR